MDVTPSRSIEATERLDEDVTEYFTDDDFEINNLGFYCITAYQFIFNTFACIHLRKSPLKQMHLSLNHLSDLAAVCTILFNYLSNTLLQVLMTLMK